MNQIKPYLFWIAVGAVLLLEIGYWVLSMPAVDVLGNKAEAQKAKTSLDTEYNHLKELDRRAKNGSPMGVFDAEKASDIAKLTNDYLITPAWTDVLEPHVKRYDEQLTEIKKHLAARSKRLNEPIASSSDKFGWYTVYQNLTEEQLKQLAAAKALAMPTTGTGKNSAAAPMGALGIPGAAGMGAAKPVSSMPAGEPDFATDATLRSLAGFFTKGAENPDPAEHPALTRQFRTMERVIAVILATSVSNTANPLAGETTAPEQTRAALAGVTWDTAQGGAAIGGDAGSYASGWRLTVNLQGPLTAILATIAELEHAGGDAPVFVVTGSEISRKAAYALGERKDVGAEQVTARLGLLVLDFSDALTGTKPIAPSAAPAGAPRPGMPPGGFPGGFPGSMPGGFPGGMPPGAPGGAPRGTPASRSVQQEENQ